jgi:DNA repair protein RAD5
MGKTIMLSALIQSSPAYASDLKADASAPPAKPRQLKLGNAFRPALQRKATRPPSATLIVAPTSLLSQWSEEMQRSSKPGTVNVLIWHGQNRLDLEAAIEENDEDDKSIKIIITSYGVLASEHAKWEKSTNVKSPVFESWCGLHMPFMSLMPYVRSRMASGCPRRGPLMQVTYQ